MLIDISGYEGIYQINPQGEIYSCYRKTPLKGWIEKTGYRAVSLWKEGKATRATVHTLLAKQFIPNPNNLPEVNHIDGCRIHNHVSNLEWVSRQGNALHAVRTGLKTYTNRLTKDEFVECLMSVIAGETYLELSKRVPYQVPFLSTKLRKIAQELGVEADLNEAIRIGKVNRARKNGTKFLNIT